jgi:hypothetical protein
MFSGLRPEPSQLNSYLVEHAKNLLRSYSLWTGRSLVDPALPATERARLLFQAPYVVLSHDTAADPVFNYANRAGLELFEYSWEELTRTPSRASAEPVHQSKRRELLDRVAKYGYIDDYRGIRISKSGRRFLIERATVWNLVDNADSFYGQAATFSSWTYLE